MIKHLGYVAAICASALAAGCTSKNSGGRMRATTQPMGSGSHVTVPVELDEYVIRMPSKIPPGDATFDVKNVGHHTHNIKIQGTGVDAALPKNLRAGESATMDVHLDPGTYKVTCPVGPHAMMGMRRTVTVK